MEVLNNELAKSIVDRTINIIGHNINIMNEQGVIIASGDKKRIGTIHEGAVIALHRKTEFNVEEGQSEKLKGVSPGVNLVIEFQNQIVGVIGITGKPEEVLGFGKLIKLTAEMMIEQEYVMKELEWNNRIKEEIILSIVYNKQDSIAMVEKYTEKFNIPHNGSMVIFIFEVDFKDISTKEDPGLLNKVLIMLEGKIRESLAAVINSRTIVFLYKRDCNNIQTTYIEQKLISITEEINKQLGISMKVSIGKVYDKIADMHKSFEIAKETLLFGKKTYPDNNIYVFNLLKEKMLFSTNDAKWKLDELEATYELIALNDKNGELRETLKGFFEENGEMNNISNRLFIHRNTLKYRLEKIYNLTNKNPKNYIDLFWLYSAMVNFYANK
jgi:carbohydrate diacid regulator